MELDTRTEDAKQRLKEWGRHFRYRPFEPRLGHRDKNMLQVAIEHKGQFPEPAKGFKPEHVDPRAMEIEDMVRFLFAESSLTACVLRGYYCGNGRPGVERLDQARDLIRAATGKNIPLNRRDYYRALDNGVQRVAGMLAGVARGHEIRKASVRTVEPKAHAA